VTTLEVRARSTGSRCRCGTKLEVGSTVVRFRNVPSIISGMLENEEFCGIPCARAFLLEALEFLEAASPLGVATDVEEARVAFRVQLGLLALEEPVASPTGARGPG